MITIEIDETKLDKLSHIEIRKKKKDQIVIAEIPKGAIVKEVAITKYKS